MRMTGGRARLACAARVAWLAITMVLGTAHAQPSATAPTASAAPAAAPTTRQVPVPAAAHPAPGTSIDTATTIALNHRAIVRLHATLMGRTPAQRAALANDAIRHVLDAGGPGEVSVWIEGAMAGLRIDGTIVFHLVSEDLDLDLPLPAAAQRVQNRLQQAVREHRESRDLGQIGRAALASVLVLGASGLFVWTLFAVRRRLARRLSARLARWQGRHDANGVSRGLGEHLASAGRTVSTLLVWAVTGVVVDLCVSHVLRQFAYTRPWGERATDWSLEQLAHFALAIAGAVPGLLSAALIFLIARLLTRALAALMGRVEAGEITVGGLDRDTAGATRRVAGVLIWLFALAIAYPFLPGATSEAFKGVSVLAGLMLSLGASGVVSQVVSGLSLMYSRTLRAGEYVRIGDTEGTVSAVGLIATRIQTGMGEEVSLPNAVIIGQPVRNFSRLVADGQFVLHTGVTIGYATPWRQVHAMLLEAARRTPGVASDPAPYVIQTALSDFYVEYRLCAQGDRGAPRRRAEALSQLHGHIQDVFNEHGVQIMSPHYLADPAEPQVVRPDRWYASPARRAEGLEAGGGDRPA